MDDKYRLFVMLKNVVPLYDGKQFNEWFHKTYPGREQHHILAAFSHRKTTNLLSFPVTEEEHKEAQANKIDFAFDHLPEVIAILVNYVKFLESSRAELKD